MSKYTTEVRYICEINSGLDESAGGSSVNKILESSAPKIFDFDFPIFDEDYRLPLEIKILKHFYTREIGFETVGLWKLWMDKRLNEIMPYYNQLYLSTLKEFNPFYDVDITTDSTRNINHDETGTSKNKQDTVGNVDSSTDTTRTDDLHSTSTRTDDLRDSRTTAEERQNTENHEDHSTGSSNSKSYQLYSDTPQNQLSGVDNETYLTNATKTTTEGSTKDDSNGSSNGSESGTTTSTGSNTGTQSNVGSDTGTVKNTGTATTDSTETVNSDGSTSRKYDNVDSYLEHVRGKRGGASYSELLLQYRKTFLNIDMMVIDNLSDLFMNVW